jgi:hypothetical protein
VEGRKEGGGLGWRGKERARESVSLLFLKTGLIHLLKTEQNKQSFILKTSKITLFVR